MADKDMILINDLYKAFGDKTVFKGLKLSIRTGAVTCIMGASGSGKTTLLNIISGLLPKDKGEISFPFENPSFSWVFQENRLCDDFSAVANIKLVTGKKLSLSEIRESLSELGLDADLNKPVSEFSGGMKRRVAIARAMLYDGDIVILDEPFKGLDENMRETVIRFILSGLNGRTCICVTHDRRDVDDLKAILIEI